ncbi:EF-P 5-aminopentanol modification-associated protein YfmF [Fructobacillus ficulneus]|uniref:Putative metalloprotease n=1 Tax=Fructobacillus ficulneus TaxID=157463 RepID=A0A0K8MIM2_9LACO|nr:insulinase family protein [Fructobacillus ficulneus]GAP00009.1 putative metalloprotease [Fructobacillus ficulneus]
MKKTTTIAPGISLVHQLSQQFQTINLTITFASKAQKGESAKRALLSYLMAVSSKKYPNQRLVSEALIDNFGAGFQTKVSSLGDLNLLTVSLQIIQPGLLPESADLLVQSLDFLKEMIFNFDWQSSDSQAVLDQEKQNLIQAILGRQDDKVLLALDQAREITFADPAAQESVLGSVEEVRHLSLADLQRAQSAMLNLDQVVVSVVGDVKTADLANIFKSWPWPDNENRQTLTVEKPKLGPELTLNQKKKDLTQAVLVQNYQLHGDQAESHQQNHYATLIFNTIFGASPASRLFTQVREKYSLAYNVSSRYQSDLDLITVVAGFDARNLNKVQDLIRQQINFMQSDDIGSEAVENAKKVLINDYLVRQDSPNFRVVSLAAQSLKQRETSEADFIKGVRAVKTVDVQLIAQRLTPQTTYVLQPE